MERGSCSNRLVDIFRFLNYLCSALRPISRRAKRKRVFRLGFAVALNLSTKLKSPLVKQKPDARVRCICKPQGVIHISLRMASVCCSVRRWGCR